MSVWFIGFTFYPAAIEKCYIEILVEKIEFTKMCTSYSVFLSCFPLQIFQVIFISCLYGAFHHTYHFKACFRENACFTCYNQEEN